MRWIEIGVGLLPATIYWLYCLTIIGIFSSLNLRVLSHSPFLTFLFLGGFLGLLSLWLDVLLSPRTGARLSANSAIIKLGLGLGLVVACCFLGWLVLSPSSPGFSIEGCAYGLIPLTSGWAALRRLLPVRNHDRPMHAAREVCDLGGLPR